MMIVYSLLRGDDVLTDIIVVGIIGLCTYISYKRGFVKSVSKLCCWVVSVIVAKFLSPYVSGFVRESFVGDYINNKMAEAVGENVSVFVRQVSEYTAEGATDVAVSIISVLLIIIITYFIANFIVGALNIVAKIPVISSADRFLGLVTGLVTGFFIVYLVLAVMVVADVQGVDMWIDSSVVAYHMFRHNILLDLIF